ncbi:beta-lactamase-like protein [Stanieria sp. NIES-3757]|nr:beta-lactamase-like protein [Stanieria sp. NIES-3757]
MPENTREITLSTTTTVKTPRSVLPGVFSFSPNRDTLGATAYFIVDKTGNILLDCPTWNEMNQEFILAHGGVNWLVISHRGGIGKGVAQIQQALNCEVIIQEQEAYLLPESKIQSFAKNLNLSPSFELIWTPGHSPGSACLYWQENNGVLFSGRHLLPDGTGTILPLRTAKTFHWWRQLQSIQKLRDRFSSDNLNYICPGANTGFLRGKGFVDNGYQRLTELDLAALKSVETWDNT